MQAIRDFLLELWESESVKLSIETLVRLSLAALMGGVIGYERQHSHRPAGMRTHVLVAVGSALVMCTSVFIFEQYSTIFQAKSVPDPARLGAQVISGIGFLGAGTILREGFSVKGLTTAASLWAVACIGLAVGIGFWSGALIATFVIFLTLNSLKRVAIRYSHVRIIYIGVDDAYHVSEKATEVLRNCGAKLRSLEIMFPEDRSGLQLNKDTSKVLKAMVYVINDQMLGMIREGILGLEGVHDFYVEL
ncbi:MAG: MgtC/SapB family protein [Oscillospiraceae bacterium]|jgi:putative Mg2+ transporter-C (MgtC) family protein|nr:MgtC/SapB family protein [Oscillospiraceae bacterium]